MRAVNRERVFAYTLGDSIAHYDHLRQAGALERDARHAAEFHLRRKCAGVLDADAAAVVLADALARRGAQRLAAAEAAIIQR